MLVERDFPPSSEPVTRLVAREVMAFLGASLLLPFGLRRSRRQTRRAREQRTVVLVHGYLANRASLAPLGAWLRLRGVKVVLGFDYDARRGVEGAAIELSRWLRERVRGGRIDLVCHSLGGLVARVYLQALGGARRVDRCITLGTPHLGTYNAYWVASRIGRELRPDSTLLARLQATRDGAARVRFTSIVAGSDNIVIPRVFSVDAEDLVRVPDLGHLGLLFSPAVYQVVASRLVAKL
jgi:triacylglycerol esterase/lipase EstA (alpha/beta hydrolase family)